MNQHPVPMTRQGLVPALGRGQVQELARYKLPNFILLFNLRWKTTRWISCDNRCSPALNVRAPEL
jgi:hypothetical protein